TFFYAIFLHDALPILNVVVLRQFTHDIAEYRQSAISRIEDSNWPHISLKCLNYFNKCGFSLYVFHKNSPNNVFAQANHERVNFLGSSLWKDSCIKPVSPCVRFNKSMHFLISLSSMEVSPRMVIAIGQIMSRPMCGPPIPSAADPLKKKGFSADNT